MAAARIPGRRRMGACETTPPATHREHATRPPGKPTATDPPSSLSMISRRLPASSSSVLAAARLRALQPDPWPHGRKTRAAARKDPQEQSAPARRQHGVTGPGPYALLTLVALMGAAYRAWAGSLWLRQPPLETIAPHPVMPPTERGSGWKRTAVRTVLATCRTCQEHQLPLSACHVRAGSLNDMECDRVRSAGVARCAPPRGSRGGPPDRR
jgi:hypothetical protein